MVTANIYLHSHHRLSNEYIVVSGHIQDKFTMKAHRTVLLNDSFCVDERIKVIQKNQGHIVQHSKS